MYLPGRSPGDPEFPRISQGRVYDSGPGALARAAKECWGRGSSAVSAHLAYQETMPHGTNSHLTTRRTLFPPLDNFFLLITDSVVGTMLLLPARRRDTILGGGYRRGRRDGAQSQDACQEAGCEHRVLQEPPMTGRGGKE